MTSNPIQPQPAKAGKDRTMPVGDFYADFARASFGANVAAAAGAIMAGVDGVKMPKITDWISGPGCIVTNGAPWENVKQAFDFVERFAALRAEVRGRGESGAVRLLAQHVSRRRGHGAGGLPARRVGSRGGGHEEGEGGGGKRNMRRRRWRRA